MNPEYIWFGLVELLRLLEVENIVFHNTPHPPPRGQA